VAKPFLYNNTVEGAVYLSSPVPEVNKARTNVIKFFIFSVLISIAVSVLLAYFFSRKISDPLKQISNATKEIEKGDFSKRLDVKSDDEIGELARSFNDMASALQNLEEMRRDFIANVSHEFRTPMTSILGFIDGIIDGTIPQNGHNKYLNIVRDEIARLNKLANNLLDLARLESGETLLNFTTFDINELIRICIIKLENAISEKNIDINAELEGQLMVFADKDAIERVLINLIHNAVKFTDAGGQVIMSTSRTKSKALITVTDTGIGISQDEISLIWERFYKSDKSRSLDKSGTGLGLAIVKNIIKRHNQNIWVESEPGKGTKFTFTLNESAG
jgi:signal transduction histidine kinase